MKTAACYGFIIVAALAATPARAQSVAAGDIFQDALQIGGQGPEMVVLPPGGFQMGDIDGGGDNDERPPRNVNIGYPLAMMTHEVRRVEFRVFADATGYQTDAEKNAGGNEGCYTFEVRAGGEAQSAWTPGRDWRNAELLGLPQENDRHPAVCISRRDAQAYAEWLSAQTGASYRLPSEAEWEYAARAGTTTPRYFGSGKRRQCGYANGSDQTELPGGFGWGDPADCRDAYPFTAPGGTYRANDFGLHDMLGNVWEWVSDCYQDGYRRAPTDGSARSRCNPRGIGVLRGGSWFDAPKFIRAAERFAHRPTNRDSTFGFRLARELGS